MVRVAGGVGGGEEGRQWGEAAGPQGTSGLGTHPVLERSSIGQRLLSPPEEGGGRAREGEGG